MASRPTEDEHERLFAEHTPRIRQALRAAGLQDCDVEDGVQHVWIAFLRGGYDPAKPAGPYLRQVTRHAIAAFFRGRSPRLGLDEAAVPARPERATEKTERFGELDRLVERLGARDREILTLRLVDGLTHRDVAERLGLGVPAARVSYHRALQRLKRLVDGVGPPTIGGEHDD